VKLGVKICRLQAFVAARICSNIAARHPYFGEEYMKFLLGLMFSLTLFAAVADEDVADAALIAELKQYCNDIAEEDGTDGQDLNTFLLECVNNELTNEGYQKVEKI
jgi:hypothetical protein|tara:strand:- start:184 stop:501 length:318 start_codon:yes stop_codon:yes gene_type:complete